MHVSIYLCLSACERDGMNITYGISLIPKSRDTLLASGLGGSSRICSVISLSVVMALVRIKQGFKVWLVLLITEPK